MEAFQSVKTHKYMNDYSCPCLMKTDLEQSVDKISFLKEYYPGIESPGYIEALPKQELLCCLCLLDSILFSIEQEYYMYRYRTDPPISMQRKSSETFPLREYLFKKMNMIIKDCKSIHFSITRMYILMYQECTFLRYKSVHSFKH